MFAVIRTGGKQYRVASGDLVTVEKLAGEPGDAIEFDEVLMVGNGAAVSTGTPLVAGAAVSATLVEQSRAAKIIVFKKKRRHNYRRKKGHRQYQSVLRIDEISASGFAPASDDLTSAEEWPAAEEGPAVETEPASEAGPLLEEGSLIETEPAIEQAPAPDEGVEHGS
jgi:large subunit ribosomal protein L21